jgi:hypothetical protein
MIKLYLNDEGNLIDEESSILSPDNISMMEKLISEQKDEKLTEEEWNKFKSNIIIPPK